MFSLESIQFETLYLIGNGRYSSVYSGRYLQTNQLVAIKQINLESLPFSFDKIFNKLHIWATSPQMNLVEYYGSFINGSILWIIMEFMDGGSLSDIMKFGFRHGFTDEILLASILKRVLIFLYDFHRNGNIHRSIKPTNILLKSNGKVKIATNFHAASFYKNGDKMLFRSTCSEIDSYTAPEILLDGHAHTEVADIWSLGITMIGLASGKTPFSHMNPMEQMVHIINEPSPTLPDSFSDVFKDFVRICLNKNPSKRPKAAALLKHKFIKMAKDSEYISAALMSQLPPLFQRSQFVQKQITNEIEANIQKITRCSCPIKFNFDLTLDSSSSVEDSRTLPKSSSSQKSIKINRFTFSRRKSSNNEPNPISTDTKFNTETIFSFP